MIFFAKYSDVLKYNNCGTCFIGQENRFLDIHNENNKKEIKEMMRQYDDGDIIFNKTLLSSNSDFEKYDYNLNEIVTNCHAIVIKSI